MSAKYRGQEEATTGPSMMTMRFGQMVDVIRARLLNGKDASRSFTGVSTDSRTVGKGALFIAIRGAKHDGHDYLSQAREKGAAGILVDERYLAEHGKDIPGSLPVVVVENTHEAMITLARKYLEQIEVTRIGVTGSNGKTTTKEFIYRLLTAVSHNVYRSPGNFNNLFGIPLAIFAMPPATRLAVLEMGISTPGEMARLAALVKPSIVTITNISATHLAFLGTVEAVAREKLELIKQAEENAPLVINADDKLLMTEARKVCDRIVTFGMTGDADFKPESIQYGDGTSTVVTIDGDRFEVPLFGQYQVYNLLAAYATVRTLGYDFHSVDVESIDLNTAPMRGEIISSGGVTFVADCYNANPQSVQSGLRSFDELPVKGRRVVVLGDMLELGGDETKYHRAVGQQLASLKIDLAVLVGPLSGHAADAAVSAGMKSDKVLHFATATKCAEALDSMLKQGDTVYLKGSRGIGLEAVLKRRRVEEVA